jgi:hypothetical protein
MATGHVEQRVHRAIRTIRDVLLRADGAREEA